MIYKKTGGKQSFGFPEFDVIVPEHSTLPGPVYYIQGAVTNSGSMGFPSQGGSCIHHVDSFPGFWPPLWEAWRLSLETVL